MIVSDTTSIRSFIQDRLRDEIHFWFTDELYRQMQYLAGDHK
jgi:hypothetical protein